MTDRPAIRAVIFDFGKVICDFDLRLFLKKLAPHSTRSMDELSLILKQSMDLGTAYETGLMTSQEFYLEISSRAGVTMPEESFRDAYCNIFTPIKTTVQLIRQLKAYYRLGLLSNTSEWHFEYGIKPVEIFPLFDVVTLSYKVKAMKPARSMYDNMITGLGLPPAQCVYIDDILENVEAGRQLGLHAIHYTTPEELMTELRRIGLKGIDA